MPGRSVNTYVLPSGLASGTSVARSPTSVPNVAPPARRYVTRPSYASATTPLAQSGSAGSSGSNACWTTRPGACRRDGSPARRERRRPHRAVGDRRARSGCCSRRSSRRTRRVAGSIRETVPSPLLATQTAPSPTAIAPGSGRRCIVSVTASVAGSMRETVPPWRLATQTAPAADRDRDRAVPDGDRLDHRARPRLDAEDGAAFLARDPHRAGAGGDRRRVRAEVDPLGPGAGREVDPHDVTVDLGGDPHRRRAGGDAARAVADVGPSVTTRFVPGSICDTVRSWPSVTHSDPAMNASPAGSSPTRIVTVWPCSRSIRETVPSLAFATQTDPPPTASALGSRPTGYCT